MFVFWTAHEFYFFIADIKSEESSKNVFFHINIFYNHFITSNDLYFSLVTAKKKEIFHFRSSHLFFFEWFERSDEQSEILYNL